MTKVRGDWTGVEGLKAAIEAASPLMRVHRELQQRQQQHAELIRSMGGPRVLRELNQQTAMLRSMGLAPRLGSAQSYDPAPSRPAASPAPAAPTAPAPVVEAPAESEREAAKRRARSRGQQLRQSSPKEQLDRLKNMTRGRALSKVAGDFAMTVAELRALERDAKAAVVAARRSRRPTRT